MSSVTIRKTAKCVQGKLGERDDNLIIFIWMDCEE